MRIVTAGHALWSGVADPEKAQRIVERLMADDMFNG
jgi:glycogen debranching enzyme